MLFLPIQKFTEAAKRCETSASTFSTRLRIVSFKTPAFKKQHMALHRELQVEGVKAKSYCARHPSKTASCHCHNEGSGAQTKACATLGLCDLRGTLRQCDHLRPYSKTIFGATAPRVGLRWDRERTFNVPRNRGTGFTGLYIPAIPLRCTLAPRDAKYKAYS